MKMKYQVFISYRREGGEVLGRMLYEELIRRGYSVFYDVESLRSGRFNIKLYQVIDECTDVLVILSPGGLDRCSDPDDWVRREIAYALQKKKNVIPVLIRGFSFKNIVLPDDMKELPDMNGIEANMELFPAVMDRLAEKMMYSKPKGMNAVRKKANSADKEKDGKEQIVSYILMAVIIFIPYFSRHYYSEPEWMPDPINKYLMLFKTMPVLLYLLLYACMFGVLIISYDRSLKLKRKSTAGLELCDFEKSFDEFVKVITSHGDIARMQITKRERKKTQAEEMTVLDADSMNASTENSETKAVGLDALAERFARSVIEEGMLIGSYNGDKPDYMLVSFPEYKGVLQLLYLSRITTKLGAMQLLTDQEFALEWQKANNACYKNGEWTVRLSFGGIAKCLLVVEMIRGERDSVFEIAAKQAAQQTLAAELRKGFSEIRDELKKDLNELRNDIKGEEETKKRSEAPASKNDSGSQSDTGKIDNTK